MKNVMIVPVLLLLACCTHAFAGRALKNNNTNSMYGGGRNNAPIHEPPNTRTTSYRNSSPSVFTLPEKPQHQTSSVVSGPIFSNGSGGGDWDAPSTWQGGVIPGTSDSVVIVGNDHVTSFGTDYCFGLWIRTNASLAITNVIYDNGGVLIDGNLGVNSFFYVNGNWVRSSTGSFNNGGNVCFSGDGDQNVSGSGGETFSILTVLITSGGLHLASDVNITDKLILDGGLIYTGTFHFHLVDTVKVSYAGAWVVGAVEKSFSTGAQTFRYPIGDSLHFTPVTTNFNNISIGGTLAIRSTRWDHPLIESSGIDAAHSINRYYSFVKTGLAFDQCLLTFGFSLSDIDPGVKVESTCVRCFNGSFFSGGPINSNTGTSIQITSNTCSGDYLFGELLHGGGGWSEQRSLTSNQLESISIVDDQTVWASGDNGVVLHTSDGGANWLQCGTFSSSNVYNICAVNSDTALVCVDADNDARIYRTADAGSTWSLAYQNIETGAFLDAVCMLDPQNGYALGNPVGGQWVLLRTTNGGADWSSFSTLPQTGDETGSNNGFFWTDASHGWISVNKPWIFRTTDGGADWEKISVLSDYTDLIAFVDNNIGMVSGQNNLMTTDGGATWNSPGTTPGTSGVSGASFPRERWWLTQYNGMIQKSANRGGIWTLEHVCPTAILDIVVKNIPQAHAVVGYAVGSQGLIAKHFTMYKTITASAGPHGALQPSGAITDDYGFDTTIIVTPDAGYHVDSVFVNGAYKGNISSYRFNNVRGDSTLRVVFALTTLTIRQNMRAHWNMISVPFDYSPTRKDSLYSSSISDAYYFDGDAYSPENILEIGKAYWLKFPGETEYSLTGLPCGSRWVQVNTGWNMVGTICQRVLVSTITTMNPDLALSQFFGYRGSYLQTDTLEPGVGYWVKANESGYLFLSSPSGPGREKSATVSGHSPVRIVPTAELPPAPPFEMMENTEKPEEYALDQNFPNPFNPATDLKYALPVDSYVRLTLYNTLGQVVARLVDGVQTAGLKGVSWNAGSNSSGLYIYRLDAASISDPSNHFSDTRKMILLK